MIFLQLFLSYCKIGLFTFGGGYAALPLIQEEIVNNRAWITMQEFTDIITISQMTPGPIGINAATFVGTKVAGVPGAIVATLGAVTPSLIIVLSLAVLYYKYKGLSLVQSILKALRPAVVAFIASAGVSLVLSAIFSGGDQTMTAANFDLLAVGLIMIGLLLFRYTKIGPIQYMVATGIVGLIVYGFLGA